MTRALLAVALAAVLGVALAAGCTLFQDLPDRSCSSDRDCFVAQGERCDLAARECVAADTGLDAWPGDAATPDAAP